jgi:excinuclease UvrABC nuclease subunit
MNSSEFSDYRGPFNFDTAYRDAPEASGIYFLRLKSGKTFPRILGCTDIIYIGSTTNLKQRFNEYNHPGPTQWTNIKVNRFVKKYGHESEFFWKKINEEEIEREEQKLLRRYEKEHHEKPPLNGADVRET